MDNFDIDNIDPACVPGAAGCFWGADGNPVVAPGYTVHVPTVSGGPAPIKAAGLFSGVTYVADTSNPQVAAPPYNPFGAPTYDLSSGGVNVKPEWMIAPVCGRKSQMWDFAGTSTANFGFWAAVKANWFQLNPLGDDFARGGVGANADDPRFNWQYNSTVYVTLTDLTMSGTDSTWRKFYRPGSIYRSNVLGGYKPAWARPFTGYTNKSTVDIPYATQKYFAVNLGVEAPDRMESQSFGLKSAPVYEYYGNLGVTVSWDARVMNNLPTSTSWVLTKTGGSRFQADFGSECATPLNCKLTTSGVPELASATSRAIDHQIALSLTGGVSDRGGYVSVLMQNTQWIESGFWTYFNTTEYYSYWDPITDVVTKIGDGPTNAPGDGTGTNPPPRTIPKTFYFRGFAKIRCMTANDSTCITQDGPDADPEFWLGAIILKVKAGQVGRGSEIKVDTYQSNMAYDYHKSFDGFDTTPDPDPLNPKTNAGPNRASDLGIFTVMNGTTKVIDAPGPKEYANPLIRHRGPAISEGSFQGWGVSVCIR